jgi:diphthine-ammonia ligase
MCGIIGVFGQKNGLELVKTGLEVMEKRGIDNIGYYEKEGNCLGHCLHSVVGAVKQPLKRKGVLVSNCEIYNWKELNEKHGLNAKNDAVVLSKLLEEKKIGEVINELDGVYAFAHLKNNRLVLIRDILGVKPIWFSHEDGFAFASEKKALEKIGKRNVIELNPRKILVYDVKNDKIMFFNRKFFNVTPEITASKKDITDNVIRLLKEAVVKRIPERKVGLLFSGGVDSSVLALLLKKFGVNFTCYVAGVGSKTLKEPEDVEYAKKCAKSLNLDLKIISVKEEDVEHYLKKIVPLIEDTNVVKVGVALPFYVACEQAKKDGCKVVFSGLGSDEIFAGYERHKKSQNVNDEGISCLLKTYERDTYRDDVVTMANSLELRLPFLDLELIKYALRIPEEFKLGKNKNKIILRDAAEILGLDERISQRKKKAAQYGSNFHKMLKKLTKKHGFKYISDYLRGFYCRHNLKLGALVSSGKDSVYAMHVMKKQNYGIECMIALKSKNPDSFMFHYPGIDLVKLQAKSFGLPLVMQETKGEKEKELMDLKKALKKAKDKYGIEGVITGALFSNYQRERIEKVADSLGLKIFSPLWHMNQELEMRQMIDEGFEFILTKISADGLDKSWLNKVIGHDEVDKLVKLNDEIGINIAFEGGEAESLMINGPMFSKKIEIVDAKIKEESKIVAELLIKKAKLVKN